MEQRGVSPVVGTILLIAITVALAAIVAMLVSGLGGRGAPPSVMLSVSATSDGENLSVAVKHNGGDDLQLKDLTVKAINSAGNPIENVNLGTGTFDVGSTQTITFVGSGFTGFYADNIITVYVIHNPSKQMIFNASGIKVTSA